MTRKGTRVIDVDELKDTLLDHARRSRLSSGARDGRPVECFLPEGKARLLDDRVLKALKDDLAEHGAVLKITRNP